MAKYISGRADSNSLKKWATYSRQNSYHNKRGDQAGSSKSDDSPHKYHEPRHGAGTGLGRAEMAKQARVNRMSKGDKDNKGT